MDRALDLALLRRALGELPELPTAEELADALAEAEIALLARRRSRIETLLPTAWFLFGVASSDSALRRYGVARQRAAFQVASHIFDLGLTTGGLAPSDQLSMCFACQMANLRGELTPNATAIYRREFSEGPINARVAEHPEMLALSTAVALAATDFRHVFDVTDTLRRDLHDLSERWRIERFSNSVFAAAVGTALACRHLAVFLLYGLRERLESARTLLLEAVRTETARGDYTSRWVAAQLLDLTTGLDAASVWTALPPEVPDRVRRAFVLTKPSIALLWPPQLQLLSARNNQGLHPFSTDLRRQLFSTPTSGGKTLIAQLLVATHLSLTRTNVCYVAPTRSLCHEIRESLSRRLRHLGSRVLADLPVGLEEEFFTLTTRVWVASGKSK